MSQAYSDGSICLIVGKLLNWVILLGSWFLLRLRTVSQKYFKDLMEGCYCTELLACYSVCISNWCEKLALISAPPTDRFQLDLLKWLTITIIKSCFIHRYSWLQLLVPQIGQSRVSAYAILQPLFIFCCFSFSLKPVITTKASEKKRGNEIIQRNIHASAN